MVVFLVELRGYSELEGVEERSRMDHALADHRGREAELEKRRPFPAQALEVEPEEDQSLSQLVQL